MALLLGLGLSSFALSAAEVPPLLQDWLRAQTNVQTWSAQVVQTRTLTALTQPLEATGRVWFRAPDRFRWEIGDPPKTIALRQPDSLLVVYPRLRRAERYVFGQETAGPWRDTLALLEAGFPRSQADLESRFRIVSQTLTDGVCTLGLEPKSAAARRMMPEVRIVFSTNDMALCATEMRFADHSSMRNDFRQAQLNPSLDEALFEFSVPADYQVVEPLRR